jgi:hypothetical protein
MLSGGAAVAGAFSALGMYADAPGTAGTKATFGSAEKSVGGDKGRPGTPGIDCMPGTPGNENIPATSGNDGAVVSGAIGSKSRKYAEDPGADGADAVGMPGANVGTFPSDAGIARRSSSVNGEPGTEAGIPGTPGNGCAPGTAWNANASFSEGYVGDELSGEVRSRK